MVLLGLLTISFLSVPVFNYYKKITISRIILSVGIPLIAILISIITKRIYSVHLDDFFNVRVFILVASIIPPIIFTREEKKELYGTLLFYFILIALFDPIHNYFGIGFYQMGFESSRYFFFTIVNIISFFFITGIILAHIHTGRAMENEKEELLKQLNLQNTDLINKNKAIEKQKTALLSANKRVEEQTEELSNKNQELEFLINEKTRNLVESNNELVQYNNELRQFSYTISHNLRAPVASLIGLTNIIDGKNLSDDNLVIIDHIRDSANKLDNVFKDLNKIIDLRNSLGTVKEKVVLEKEIREIKNMLQGEIESSKTTIEENLDVPVIYAIRPFINSILFNLISNAIKYRTKERKPVVRISSIKKIDQVCISVADNGMGMDIETFKEDIFKMYKRFHQHTEGKGLGLYLVKLQTESMGGTIVVESKINHGSKFTIILNESGNIEDQTIFETDFCRIFYDAFSDTTGIVWKRPVSDEEYKSAFTKSLEVFRQFKTPNWISDLNNIGPASPEKQKWMINSVIPEAMEYGLKKLAIVINIENLEDEQKDYIKKLRLVLNNLGVKSAVFLSQEDGKNWLLKDEDTK